jgi:hypothetical protein
MDHSLFSRVNKLIINDEEVCVPPNVYVSDDDGLLMECYQTYYDPASHSEGTYNTINVDIKHRPRPGVYHISITKASSPCTRADHACSHSLHPYSYMFAHGSVELLDNGDFMVNGVLNGPLNDRWDREYFPVYPRDYRKFFTNFKSVMAAALAMEQHLAHEVIEQHILPMMNMIQV